jgi:excisionase family DNA binding protein
MSNLPAPIMTSEQVAELLRCSSRTVEEHARNGSLPGVKYGDGWVFPAEALLEAVNEAARGNLGREKPKARSTSRKAKRPALFPIY